MADSRSTDASGGPLSGLRIVEIAGLGPGPFAAMMLADHGADVIRVTRPGERPLVPEPNPLHRNRRCIEVDLKHADGAALVRRLATNADGLIEGFRPGVMERLGLGPDILLAEHPRLVYGRMTGWGQSGPYAHEAGHDINYIALAGALHGLGRAGDKPTPPANLLGDFGGGGMLLAFGMLAAILHARDSGRGQVIDCAMTDGASLLTTILWGLRAAGQWREQRGTNFIDSGAHFYDSYETADGRWISIGAVEPQFYARLRALTGTDTDPDFDAQMDRRAWPRLKERLAQIFRSRTRDEWCALMEGQDACFAPVLAMSEAPEHPYHRARNNFCEVGGIVQPAPAPRYSATPPPPPRAASTDSHACEAILAELGLDRQAILELQQRGVFGAAREPA
jgi:alpha-methylacyl-CoA racemase